jgi:predicted double-glycine peptidase
MKRLVTALGYKSGGFRAEFADLDALEGEALEGAIAKLSPAQREKWVRGR